MNRGFFDLSGIPLVLVAEGADAENLGDLPVLAADDADPLELDDEEAAEDDADDLDESEPDVTEPPETAIVTEPLTGILPIKGVL